MEHKGGSVYLVPCYPYLLPNNYEVRNISMYFCMMFCFTTAQKQES